MRACPRWRSSDAGRCTCLKGTPTGAAPRVRRAPARRSEEHTSELQSQSNLVCRLLLEKKKKTLKNKSEQHTFKLQSQSHHVCPLLTEKTTVKSAAQMVVDNKYPRDSMSDM